VVAVESGEEVLLRVMEIVLQLVVVDAACATVVAVERGDDVLLIVR